MRIGIAGGGVGGLTAAIALAQAGREVVVYEQAKQFTRVGADINLTPNAVRALDGLGLGPALRRHGARPSTRVSRTFDTGEETSRLPMSNEAEEKYGAPQLTLHRADLLEALEAAVPPGTVRLQTRVATLAETADGVAVGFADGTQDRVNALLGADGIHSAVRTALWGAEQPRFTGVVAYRAVVPRERLDGDDLDQFTKWWGPNPQSQIVIFPISAGREIFIFATTQQDSWREESWTLPGSVTELREQYAGYHSDARRFLAACDSVLKTALYERDPIPVWSKGRVTLLGDAAHPMLPFMAQGAASAIEDAVVLSRCLDTAAPDGIVAALRSYQDLRQERTAAIQLGSRGNAWLRAGGNADWVYGYDAWRIGLNEALAAMPA